MTVDQDGTPILLALEPVTADTAHAALARLSVAERTRIAGHQTVGAR